MSLEKNKKEVTWVVNSGKFVKEVGGKMSRINGE